MDDREAAVIPITNAGNPGDTPVNTQSNNQEEDTAQAEMIGRNKWNQYKALMNKHINSYARQSEVLWSEVITSVIYLVLLVVFGLTASIVSADSNADEWGPNVTVATSFDAQVTLPFSGGFDGLCRSGQCFLAFGDIETGSGCSPALQDFLDSVGLCLFGSSPQFAPNRSAFTQSTNTNPIQCKCVSPSKLRDFDFLKEERIGGAVEFTNLTDNLFNYTLHLVSPEVDAETPSFESPLTAHTTTNAVDLLTGAPLALQLALDSAILQGKSIAVGIANFPTVGSEYFEAGALGNVPFYVTFLMFISLQGLCAGVAEEGSKGLSHSLFMVGLSPMVYWAAWFTVLGIKQLFISVVCLLILSFACSIPDLEVAALLVPLLLVALWSMQFAVFLGLFNLKPKTASTLLLAVPSLFSIIPTVLAFNPAATGLPGEVHTVLAFIMPSYAFSITMMQMILLSSPEYGGFTFANYGVESAMGVRTSTMLIALLVGNVVMALLITLRFWATFGIASSNSKQRDSDSGEGERTHSGATPAVSVRGLKKGWGNFKAVDGLTVDFFPGQITAFLGHNGAGKSTTIKLLTGLYSSDGGDALVDGKSIVTEMDRVREVIGVCPQDNILWDFLTVREHMEFIADIVGVSPASRDGHITAMLEQVGLAPKQGDISKSLSGGMKRKLMLAMALVGDPKVLFLDEPTAGMDAGARRDVWSLLLRKRRGRSIILCTHYMDEADILGDRIAVIHAGKLQDAGTSSDLKIKYGKHVRLQLTVSAGADRRGLMALVEGAIGSGAEAGPERVALDTSDLMDDEELIRQVTAEMLDSTGEGDLTLLLPMDSDIARVLEALEERKKDSLAHLEDFTIVAPTLTDVFWELEQLAAAEEEVEHRATANANAPTTKTTVTLAELAKVPAHGASFWTKLWVLWGRQSTTWMRDAMSNLPARCNLPLPVREVCYAAMLTVSLLLTMIDFLPARAPAAVVNLDPSTVFAQLPGRVGLFYYEAGTGLSPSSSPSPSASKTADVVLPTLAAWSASPGSTLPVLVDGGSQAPCPLAAVINIDDPCVCSTTPYEACAEKDMPKGHIQGTSAAPYGLVAVLEFDREANYTRVSTTPDHTPAPNVSQFDVYYLIRPNRSTLASVQSVVSLVDGAVLSADAPAPTIATSFATLASESTSEEARAELDAQLDLLMAQFKGIMLFAAMLPLNNILADIARKFVHEKQNSIKQLQVLMGVLPSEYYAAKMSWDYVWIVSIFIVPVVVAVSVATSPLSSPATVLLFLAFPAAMIPLTYAVVRGWEDAEQTASRLSSMLFILFIVTYFPYFVLAIPTIVDGIEIGADTLQVVRLLLSLWPPTSLAMGLRAVILADAYGYDALAPSVSTSDLDVQDDISRIVFGESLPVETAFGPLMILIIEALLFSLLPVLGERSGGLLPCCTDVFNTIQDIFCRCVYLDFCWSSAEKPSGEIVLDGADVEDADVAEERRCVDGMNNPSQRVDERGLVNSMAEEGRAGDEATPAVLLSHVNKKYRPSGKQRFEGTTAVHDLCLRIRRRECFSLLGTNGAGKTTTLSMIMRQFEPTGGDIKIHGKSIYGLSGEADEAFKSFGFCPQHNALFDTHTTREMLTFYARIRGMARDQVEDYVESWLVGCKLMPHANTACGKLSGGNKRKLSLAIAILGSPDLTVLDEPSAGVDPAARKQLHRIINAVKTQGTTVILTTHHMSEAAKLGDRIGIMVQGHLACLGSPGHLLNAYSEGYNVTVCMTAGRSVHTSVLPLLREACPTLKITNLPSSEYVAANLGGAEAFSVVALYRALEDMRRAGEVSFFACGKSNLESVFLRFAKMANVDTLLGDDGDSSSDGPDGGERGEGAQEWRDERGDEVWGAELYLNSASKVVLEMTEDNKWGCLFGRCGGLGRALDEHEWFHTLPRRLERRGVTEEEWARMMQGLAAANALGPKCDPARACCCAVITVGALSGSWGWLCMCCPWSKLDPFQTAMREWLAECNAALEPKGIYLKGFTFGKRKSGGAAGGDKHGLSVLVFALSRMEIKRVQDEPVLQTPDDDSKYACWYCAAHKGRAI